MSRMNRRQRRLVRQRRRDILFASPIEANGQSSVETEDDATLMEVRWKG